MNYLAETPDPLVGSVVDGRYRLERLLGRGGMGCVYGGRHVTIGRPVAIKVLDPQLVSDDTARRRFEREAQSSGRLHHPNCVGVTDFGAMPDGSPYLAMELVDGITLEAVLDAETRLPLPRAVHIISHVLRGLAHAHAQGLIHRDLKPCNIMLVTEGADRDFAKILDFGLARLVGGGGERLTQIGVICGTPRYMAPEQVADNVLDQRTDLYAASAILFEMLAGRTPFDAEEPVTILKMHLKQPVPRIAEVAPGVSVPVAIEKLLHRGLAKTQAERPTSADHYLAQLATAMTPDSTIELSGSQVQVVAPPRVPRVPRARRLDRRTLMIGGAAALVAIVVAAVALGGNHRSPAPAIVAAATDHQQAEPELQMDPVAVGDSEIDAALRLARTGRGQEAATRLKALRHARPDDAAVPYALGRVYDGLGWPRPMIDAYRDAIHIDPSMRQDAALIRDLIDLLDSRSSWSVAAYMLEHEIGAPAIAALDTTATHHPSPTVRDRAARIRARLHSP